MKNGKLRLGPFQGKIACTSILPGKGVCGLGALEKKPVRVDNVDLFPGYICCDANTRSELVIPLLKNGKLAGVLDIDSPVTGRFSDEDQLYLEKFACLLMEKSEVS